MLTGKFNALVAPGKTSFLSVLSNFALLAMHKPDIRQTTIALNIFGCEIFTVRESALAYGSSLIKSHRPFLELLIVIAVCNINGTNAAIKATRRGKFQICFHGSDSFLELLKLTAFKIGFIVENMVINFPLYGLKKMIRI